MGVNTITHEVESQVSAARMFQALVVDSHNLIPKLIPQGIKSVELVQGDGGAGTIKQINFGEGTQSKYMKHRIDVLDTKNFFCKYTLIDGAMLGDKLESIVYEIKFESTSGGKCVIKSKSEYHTIGDSELNEEEIKNGKERALKMYKVVETHLLENPTIYAWRDHATFPSISNF